MISKVREVFCTVAAQEDNLGDIEIRQQMLNMVSGPSTRLHVSLGAMSSDYVDAFTFPPGTRLYRSSVRLGLRFLVESLRGRSALIFPPGPYPANTFRSAVRSFASLVAIRVAGLRGGPSITVGKSVRGTHRLAIAAERSVAKASAIYVARDLRTADALGLPIRNSPDIALLEAPRVALEPRYFTISIRYDRKVSDDVLGALIKWARTEGLEPVFVSQVQRDDAQHRLLASRLGAQAFEWGARTHAEQLLAVRRVYEASAFVVTDRLHVALFGVVGGAVPIAFTSAGEPSKISAAFEGVLPFVQVDRDNPSSVSRIDEIGFEDLRRQLRTEGVRARNDLLSLVDGVRRVLART
ncbi:polysaccharide pyruvyl transferase family protein [Marisediminicola sp. LYQ134]|uniref:polysaccharide pyruvyl transferase family protein n=1 Tax=Marisediminicola sp. LYQ134 TaxID=3391061 RepID=UPI00398313C2